MANFPQIILSFIVGKFFFGRRIKITYLLLAISTMFEFSQIIFTDVLNCSYSIFPKLCLYEQKRESRNPFTIENSIFACRALMAFNLHYMVCRLAIVDIAKIELLKNNKNMLTSLLLLNVGM